MIDWKPIKDAPKDGTPVLVCNFIYLDDTKYGPDTFAHYAITAVFVDSRWASARSIGLNGQVPYEPTHYAEITGGKLL